jgi:hypothetical protein
MNFRLRALAGAILGIGAALAPAGRATTFNWPTTPAFPTGPTNGQTVTMPYAGLGAIAITNNGGDVWQTGYPTVNDTETTGGLTNVNGFQIYLKSEPSASANLGVVIGFGYTGGVTNVSFTFWDVDSSASIPSTQFTDILKNIVGVTATGTLVPLTVVGTAGYNTVTGSGTVNATATGTANATNNTSEGDVTVTSGTVPIQEITFTYMNGATGLGAQAIGIGPITFTPIGSATPEVGSGLGALLACGAVVGLGALRRRRTPGHG